MLDTGSGATKAEEASDQSDNSSVGGGREVASEGAAPALRAPVARVTPCDPELKGYLGARFGSELVERWLGPLERSLMPDLGSLLNFVPAEQRSRFLRFWVEELLTERLIWDHPWPSLMPHRSPPPLDFAIAALEEHRSQIASEAYLFSLNLLVVFALGWQPSRPLDPTLPWRSEYLASSRLEGGKGKADADRACEYLVDVVLARKIDQVARTAYTRHGRGLKHIELDDVVQESRMLARRLIAGDTEESLARAIMSEGSPERELNPLARPLGPRRTGRMGERLAEQRQEEGGALSRSDYEYWARALHLITGERLAVLDKIDEGRCPLLKSFWPHDAANLVTHLFGISGRSGRLYQELRDWLQRERTAHPETESVDEIELADDEDAKVDIPRLSQEEFARIDWQRLLGRSATPLNLAILEARYVDYLEGRELRLRLLERGFQPPAADAIRQRLRHLKKELAKRRKRP
jgi:hypothetical protein